MAHKDSESTHIAEQFRNDKLLLLLFSFLKVVKCCTYIKKKKKHFFQQFQQWHTNSHGNGEDGLFWQKLTGINQNNRILKWVKCNFIG